MTKNIFVKVILKLECLFYQNIYIKERISFSLILKKVKIKLGLNELYWCLNVLKWYENLEISIGTQF